MTKLKQGQEFTYRNAPFVAISYKGPLLVAHYYGAPHQISEFTEAQQKLIVPLEAK